MDQVTGLLEAASEREAMTIIIGGVLSGAFLFALSWKLASMVQVVLVRVMDLLDRLHHETEDKP